MKFMKKIYIILFFLSSIIGFSQNNYRIQNRIWTFEKPKNFVIKVDNFIDLVKTGEDFLEKDERLNLKVEETILLSIAQKDTTSNNLLIASFSNNNNIKRFSLSGYVDKMVEVFKEKYKELESEVNITKKELQISGVKFYVIENTINHKTKNYTYKTKMYIAEIENTEFNISCVIDNEVDENNMTKAIVESKFN